jgi:hypothetical protein
LEETLAKKQLVHQLAQMRQFETALAATARRAPCLARRMRVNSKQIGISIWLGRFEIRARTHKLTDVGFQGLSRNLLLDQTITGFDPKRTSTSSGFAIYCGLPVTAETR